MASDTKSRYENKQYLRLILGLWMTIGDTYGARLLRSLFFSSPTWMSKTLTLRCFLSSALVLA